MCALDGFIGDPYTDTWAHAIMAAGSQVTSRLVTFCVSPVVWA